MINLRVHSNLVLCGVTNQTFGISKGNLYFEKHVLAAAQKKKTGIFSENKLEN